MTEDMAKLLEKPMGALTPADADMLFAQMAELQIKRVKVAARFDLLATRLKAKAEELTKPVKEEEDKFYNRLAAYIEVHDFLFKDPRKRKTPYGSYGLESGKPKTEITDEAKVVEFSDTHNLSLYKLVPAIDKDAVAKELETGKVPGAKKIEGQEKIVVKVEKKLLEKAERETRERLSPPAQDSAHLNSVAIKADAALKS